MSTYSDIIEETRSSLRGFVRDQEMSTYLTAIASDTATSLTVNDPAVLSRGRCEIGDEIVYVEAVNRQTGEVTVPPYGRGSDGTTAAAHAIGDKVTFNPLFPRFQVKRAIQETIRALDGTLYAVASTTFVANAAVMTYALPADTDSIVSIEWDSGTATLVWTPIRRYRLNRMADTTAWPTGVSLDIMDLVPAGNTIRVTYRKSITAFTAETDDLSVTGLLERAKDVVVYGAMVRLVSAIDVSNLTTNTIERSAYEGYGKQHIGDGANLTKFYFSLFQQRLAEEQAFLNQTYPIRPYYTR